MKKVIITTALVAVTAVTAFAQGKVTMQNQIPASLVTLTSDTSKVLAADVAQAGTAVGNLVPLASGKTLVAGLYAGPANSAVAGPYAPRAGDARGYILNNVAWGAGIIPATTYQLNAAGVLPALPAGATTVQVKVWDASYATYEAAYTAASYVGQSSTFQFTTGGSVTYPNIMTSLTTPIVVALVPEPTVAAIAGLGIASMLVFRRRK